MLGAEFIVDHLIQIVFPFRRLSMGTRTLVLLAAPLERMEGGLAA